MTISFFSFLQYLNPFPYLALKRIYTVFETPPFSLTRFFLPLGLIDRPIAISLIFALFSPNIEICLGSGIFFELLWLDSFPAGTYIPPQRQFSLFLTLGASNYFGNLNPPFFYILLLITLVFAHFGKLLERFHRIIQNKDYDKITKMISTSPSYNLKGRVVKSFAQLFMINTIGFYLSYLVVIRVGSSLYNYIPITGREINWPLVWAISFVGGVLSLRIKKSYMAFITSYVGLGLILLLLQN